jgi:diacylglycerol kinase family enzyme
MYYFVLEQPKNRWQSSFQNKIVATLEDLQIIGEIAKANPIQKPDDLCKMGLKKGYTTIVVIGSDTMINNLSAIIAKHGATLGIIPIDQKSSFYGLIGASNWEEAAAALPKRRVETFDLGRAAADRFFLTYVKAVSANNKKISQVIIQFNDYKIEVPAKFITITNGALDTNNPQIIKNSFSDGIIDIYISTQIESGNNSFLSSIFKKDENPFYSSLFHSKKIKIYGKEEILDIVAPDGKILTKTPAEISIVPNIVKIIIKKSVKG